MINTSAMLKKREDRPFLYVLPCFDFALSIHQPARRTPAAVIVPALLELCQPVVERLRFVRLAAYQFTGFRWGPGGSEPPTPPSSSLSVLTKRTCLTARVDLAGSCVEAFRMGDSTSLLEALVANMVVGSWIGAVLKLQ